MKKLIIGTFLSAITMTTAGANCVNAYQDRLIGLEKDAQDNFDAGIGGSLAAAGATAGFGYMLGAVAGSSMLPPALPFAAVSVVAGPTLTNATEIKNEMKETDKGLKLIKESELGGGVTVNEVYDNLSRNGVNTSPAEISKMVTEYNDYGELCQGEIPMGISEIERKLELDLR